MNQKPIRRNEHLLQFSREHHFTLLFSWKIRRGLKNKVAMERIVNYVAFFWHQHLQPHFLAEEKMLFALVQDEMVQKAIREHLTIQEEVHEMANHSTSRVEKLLGQLADKVDNHVRFEERQLFPHLEKILSKEQLEKIGIQLKEQPAFSPAEEYSDIFWAC
ncbi:MAG TPA: hemerythrin domain-containing protein [Puia sp.]|nr:hemerythrin domain-containing protein [Puia sp.]